jgi:hypothetical protein
VAIDDTLFKRRGKKVWAAGWFHDGSAPGPRKTGCGHNWVIAAIVVKLPFCSPPVALPVLAKLVIKGTNSASRQWLARRMAQVIARALPGGDIHFTADAAYAATGYDLALVSTDTAAAPAALIERYAAR